MVLATAYAGSVEEGVRATAPIAKLGTPIASVIGPQPYEAWQQAFDPLLTAGARNYWKTSDFDGLDDEALDVFVDAARAMPGPECEVFIAQLGGAMGRIPHGATAYAGRDAQYVMNVHGRWRSPSDDDAVRTWARRVFEEAKPFATGGGYVNFLTEDESGRVESTYGANFQRLRELKRRFDPDNFFRMNLNIPPSTNLQVKSKARARRGHAPRPA